MKLTKSKLKQIIKEEVESVVGGNTTTKHLQRKQLIRDQLIAEGWLDRLKAKAWGAGNQIEKQVASAIKGKKRELPAGMTQAEMTQGMKELYFVAHARGNFAKRLEKMAQEMEGDIESMGFGEGTAKEELEEIAALLRKAAGEIENVQDILKAREDEFEF